MHPRLVFHTGSFKGGSTAIQSALASKSCDCAGCSILYPGISPKEGPEKTRGQHGSLADALLPSKTKRRRKHKQFSRVADHMRTIGADVTVISAEKFEYVDPRALEACIREYFPDFADHVRIVFYVRPHAERLISGYAERVKHGLFLGDLEELHRKTRTLNRPHQRGFFYHPRLRQWRDVFGSRLTVRPMIRDLLFRSDVVADFFQQILDDRPFSLAPAAAKNSSPTLEDLAVVRHFHLTARDLGLPPRLQERFGLKLAQALTSPAHPGGTRLALHRSLAEDVLATYHEDAAALDRDFFTDSPMQTALRRALEGAIPEPQAIDAARHLDAGQMRQVTAWARTSADMLSRSHPDDASGGDRGTD